MTRRMAVRRAAWEPLDTTPLAVGPGLTPRERRVERLAAALIFAAGVVAGLAWRAGWL